MEPRIYRITGRNLKSMALTDSEIMLSSKTHTSIEEFEKAKKSASIFENFDSCQYENVEKLQYREDLQTFHLEFVNQKGKKNRHVITCSQESQIGSLTSIIINNSRLKETITLYSRWKILALSLFLFAVIAFFTFIFGTKFGFHKLTEESLTGTNGSGRGRVVVEVLSTITNLIGTWPVLIIGLIFIFLLSVYTLKKFKNPPRVFTYLK